VVSEGTPTEFALGVVLEAASTRAAVVTGALEVADVLTAERTMLMTLRP